MIIFCTKSSAKANYGHKIGVDTIDASTVKRVRLFDSHTTMRVECADLFCIPFVVEFVE